MPTFKEFLKVAEMSVKDKTSGERMKEIRAILKKHGAFKGITPQKAVSILEDLGPTFVKIGQIASNRADLLPKAYCDAFESLRTKVPPIAFAEVIGIIERSLGAGWDTFFSTIYEEPLGSASIAQVHKAQLKSGETVAVKVRRPGIVETMAQDITLMKHLLALVEFSTTSHEGIVFSIDNLVQELERTTADEIDFTIELNNLIRFKTDMDKQSHVTSPIPYPAISTDEVLVMEFATGILVDDKETLAKSGIDLSAIGNTLAQSYVTQVIDNGFFHADPHPGNILVNGKEIIWIDLGMTGLLTASERVLVSKVFRGVALHDSYELKEALLAMTKITGDVDHGLLLQQIDSMLDHYASTSLGDINIGTAFMDIIEILRSQNLMLPTAFTMLARGFVTLEGVLGDIAPEINVVDIVSSHVKRQMIDPEYLESKSKEIFFSGLHSAEATAKLPTQLSNTLEMLDRGELAFETKMNVGSDALASLYNVSGRIALAMISAGLFIGSSVLCTTGLQPQWLGVPVIGFLGYVGAFILGVYVIWQTLVSRHQIVNKEKVE